MILRGINTGPVHCASGATNFFGPGRGPGHGWWYHRLLKPFGLDFDGATTTAKTSTLPPRAGNMPLEKDSLTPREWFPRCIVVNRKRRSVLNAVSLSGPGLEFLLDQNIWQKQTEPTIISVMSLAQTPRDRLAELTECFTLLRLYFREAVRKLEFTPPWVVQVNLSCPNGGLDPNDLEGEAVPVLDAAEKELPDAIPVMLKFGPEVHPSTITGIRHPRLDGLCVFNTMPFGKHPKWADGVPPIDWKGIFGTDDPQESPLAKRFGPKFAGGYSGEGLLPFLLAWLPAVRARGVTIPICGGGGILSKLDAGRVLDAGADAISIGSMAMLAPTEVRRTIRYARGYAERRSRPTAMATLGFDFNV